MEVIISIKNDLGETVEIAKELARSTAAKDAKRLDTTVVLIQDGKGGIKVRRINNKVVA